MSSLTSFDKAFVRLIDVEKGFKCEATDHMDWSSGVIGKGELRGTKFGISAGAYPHLDIQNLTLDQAKALFKKDWWDFFGGDLLPEEIGYQVLDAEVNHGHKMGVKFLQRALGVEDDGLMGPKTFNSIVGKNEDKLLLRMFAIRLRYFTAIVSWPTYGKGWANRMAILMMAASQ